MAQTVCALERESQSLRDQQKNVWQMCRAFFSPFRVHYSRSFIAIQVSLGFVVSSICVCIMFSRIIWHGAFQCLCVLLASSLAARSYFLFILFIIFTFIRFTCIQWVEREQCAEDGLRNMFLVFLFCLLFFVGYCIRMVRREKKLVQCSPVRRCAKEKKTNEKSRWILFFC